MAVVTGSFNAPPSPGAALAKYFGHFMQTGELAPQCQTPTFRSGSVTTGNGTGTFNLTVSANVVAGDLMLCFVYVNDTTSPSNAPTGFSYLGDIGSSNYPGVWCYFKVATSSDPGSTVSWVTGQSPSYEWAILAYSNVDTATPFAAANAVNNNSTTSTTYTSGTYSTIFSSAVVTAFVANGNAATTVTATSGTQRVQTTNGNYGMVISEQTYGGAATVGAQTASASVASYWQAWTFIINGAPIIPATPSLPPGGWTLVDLFAANQQQTAQVWESPAASNNLGSTWYLILSYQPWGSNYNFTAAETYNSTNHTYNAVAYTGANPGAIAIGPNTSPPYAVIQPTALQVPNGYPSQSWAGANLGTGSTNFCFAVNRDGMFVSTTNGGTWLHTGYVGYCPTLITNPQLTDVPLFVVNPGNGAPNAGVTREPGWNGSNLTYYGDYFAQYGYVPYPDNPGAIMGTINGNMANNDLFQAPGNQALTCRISLYHYSVQTNYATNGRWRALLPAWIQYAQSTGCSWGDTVTQGGDTLMFTAYSSTSSGAAEYIWIDTTAG
jgi:hypothetical protein